MKWLCVCEGGNVRSVALVYALKTIANQDALACGWRWNSPETLQLLTGWADIIVLMQQAFISNLKERVPHLDMKKVFALDVGPDRFGTPMHPALVDFCGRTVRDWQQRNFVLDAQ